MIVLRKRLQAFYDYEEDNLRQLCPRLSRIESLEIRYGVDRSGLGTAA